MGKKLDVLGSLLVLAGLVLQAVSVSALAGLWWGLLCAAIESVACGLALCWAASRIPQEDEPKGKETQHGSVSL